ncbi:MAG: hypothetical protein A2V45_07940 [Candidatus Aminicenantes bacterium RBG_19FT_COMBO_58_17]|jgi:hypothetical protein|nr:MAG: hypothetical protein A2V45_07940 [Candidatus Aminicenantes bacterium RBG_19FT_COMBO_58_17]
MIMKRTVLRVLLVPVLASFIGFASGQDADLSGTWDGHAVTSDGTEVPLILTLKKAEAGYGGTVNAMGQDLSLENAKFENGRMTFEFLFSPGGESLRITMELKLDGEKLAGTWSSDQGDSGSSAFERRK